jgi:hypothetical protein
VSASVSQELITKYGEGARTAGSAMTHEEKEQAYLDHIEVLYKMLLPHER